MTSCIDDITNVLKLFFSVGQSLSAVGCQTEGGGWLVSLTIHGGGGGGGGLVL